MSGEFAESQQRFAAAPVRGSACWMLNTDYLSVGQAGNQIGTAFWENILLVSWAVPSSLPRIEPGLSLYGRLRCRWDRHVVRADADRRNMVSIVSLGPTTVRGHHSARRCLVVRVRAAETASGSQANTTRRGREEHAATGIA